MAFAALVAGACAPSGVEVEDRLGRRDAHEALTPTYEPEDGAATGDPAAPSGVGEGGDVEGGPGAGGADDPLGPGGEGQVGGGNGGDTGGPGAGGGAAGAERQGGDVSAHLVGTSAAVTDPEGDVTTSLERPPAWVDLLGARLTRVADGWELRIRVAGGAAPDSSGSPDHTMNLAFFVDLTGDGHVDTSIWANLADHGWGAGWFPPEPPNRFGDDAQVAITTEGDEVVLRMPPGHVPAERFRWSVASEWARYELLGTDTTARDWAPDRGAVTFP